MDDKLEEFLRLISKRESSDTVFNQYKDEDILNNLRLYLTHFLGSNPKVLFVGEAPGYKGCRITGIPFTSGRLILESNHEIFKSLKNALKFKEVQSENTAKILWEHFDNNSAPLLWNAFPFHPHEKNNLKSNRKPNSEEVEEGKKYVSTMIELFNPETLVALGRVGEATLNKMFPYKKIFYIRHPSYGGKKDFSEGIKNILDYS